MQSYAPDVPVVEAHQDPQIDDDQAMEKLHEELQQQLQQAAAPPAAESPAGEADGEPTPGAAAAAAAAAAPGSVASERSGCEDEWQLVSPHGSVRLHGSSRCSFDYGAPSSPLHEAASCCGSESSTPTPKDELAESILGGSVLAAAAAAAGAGACAASNGDEGEVPAAEQRGADADADAAGAQAQAGGGEAAGEPRAPAPAACGGAGEQGEVLTGLDLLRGEVVALVGAAQHGAAASLLGLREWLIESLAALVQTGRTSHAACVSTAHSLQRSLQIAAKQGGLAAAAVGAAADWRMVLSSAAAVLCLAMWLKSRNENAALRAMLRRRDHELSKLVMRVVSLQELLNQGQVLPITRYTRYERAAAAPAAGAAAAAAAAASLM